jgi:hypothetical protein
MKNLKIIVYLFPLIFAFIGCGSSSNNGTDIADTTKTTVTTTKGGYLFAHMTKSNYGHLYYSISADGKNWKTLNGGNVILSGYLGHPNIMKGGDGNYYMMGVSTTGTLRYPILWYSTDLVTWKHKDLSRSIFDVSAFGYSNEDVSIGAPKIFYDSDSQQYMVTWHAYKTGTNDNPRWESMRTYYILTKDWNTFTPVKRLFNFSGIDSNMATIDVVIVKDHGTYYAIIKDERWPETISTGKTIRIATSTSLTGPYTNPGESITPAWHEAPFVVQKMDGSGWYLYTEKYTEAKYDLYEAPTLSSATWTAVTMSPPPGGRHGCVVQIPDNIYQGILKAYNK